jgi:hypothetical protein
VPTFVAGPLQTDALGGIDLPLQGLGAQLDVFLQYAIVDVTQPQLIALSNAVRVEFLP